MIRVNVVTHGQGQPLVLFHGWGFDLHVWSALLPYLTDRYQLSLVDLPGFGLTPPMAWDVFKQALLAQLPAQFAIAGWSMGGLFATRLAVEEKARVSRLVNIASSPRFLREAQWPGIDGLVFNQFYDELVNDPEQTLNQFITSQGHPEALVAKGQRPTMQGLQMGLDVLLTWDLRQAVAKLEMPVCYMYGRLDAITPRQMMPMMQTRYPHFHYVMFRKSAHMPFLTDPSAFSEALGSFLE